MKSRGYARMLCSVTLGESRGSVVPLTQRQAGGRAGICPVVVFPMRAVVFPMPVVVVCRCRWWCSRCGRWCCRCRWCVLARVRPRSRRSLPCPPSLETCAHRPTVPMYRSLPLSPTGSLDERTPSPSPSPSRGRRQADQSINLDNVRPRPRCTAFHLCPDRRTFSTYHTSTRHTEQCRRLLP